MLGEEEKSFLRKLFPFWSERPVVFDVGSNKGGWADEVLNEFGNNCEVHLFEPVKILLDFTRIKYEYRNNVFFNQQAAFRHGGTTRPFYYFENFNNELSSIYHGGDEWAGLPVKEMFAETIRLSEYAEDFCNGEIDCIKIDCEGGDEDALIGCEPLLKKGAAKFIVIEYSPHYLRAGASFKSILELTLPIGYKCYSYSNDNFHEVTLGNFVEDYRFDNFIITKENIRNYSDGWNTEFIANTAQIGKVNFVLEVGAFEGLTSKYICEHLLLPEGRMIAVDPLEDYYTPEDTEHKEMFHQQYQRFLGNTRGLPIELRRQRSEDALPEMHEFRFDLIYLDGDHSEEAVFRDIELSIPIMKDDGYLLIDDYLWRDETKRGIDKALQHFGCLEVVNKGYQVLCRKI
jgi:FkbM family methyltransferase